MKGYIKLYRSVIDNEMYDSEPFDKFHAWVDLLLMANYESTTRLYRGTIQTTKAGEINTSIEFLAKRWHWNRKTVMTFLEYLELDDMIEHSRTNIGTAILIKNWRKYQQNGTQKRTPLSVENSSDNEDLGTSERTSERTSKRTSERTHNKKYKKYKESGMQICTKNGASASAKEMKIGDIFTDAEGFKFIVKADGSIDRYRGRQ